MLKYKVILAAFFFVNTGLVFGQSYNFTHYSIPEGLPQAQVFDICQDNFGNLWLATQGGGLSKFNGISFKNYSSREGLSSNFVRSVVCDKKGRVWAATARGVSLVRGDSISNIINSEGQSVNLIFEDASGHIWFSPSTKGIARINDDHEVVYYNETNGFFSDKVIDIKQDKNSGIIWFVTVVNGLVKYEDGVFSKVISSKELRGFALSLFVTKEVIFIGTTGGLIKFYPNKEQEKRIERIERFEGVFVKSVLQDREDNLWVITSNQVMKYYNGNLELINEKNGFSAKSVLELYQDKEGSVWLGTDGDGIYQYKDDVFTRYGLEHGLSNQNVTSVVKGDNDEYWISTMGNGLVRLKDKTFTALHGFPEGSSRYTTALSKGADGALWIGTRNGLIKKVGDEYKIFTKENGMIHNSVRDLFMDSAGRLWVATIKGLSMLVGDEIKNFDISNGLLDDVVWNIFESVNNELLIVTRKGINVFKDGALQPFLHNSLFNKRVNTIVQDKKGQFWIGYSGHGICRYDKLKDERRMITSDDGLKSNFIFNLAMDINGNIIVSTERGFDKIILNQETNEVDYIKNFGIGNDNFYNVEPNNGAIFHDRDGAIWFGSKNGIYIYNPKKEDRNAFEPTTYISNVQLFYNDVDWSDYSDSVNRWTNIPYNLKLKHNQNHINFTFFGNCLSGSSEVKYQFMLENFKDEWSPVSPVNKAAYTNLSPGNYTFKVRSMNNDGIWNSSPSEFRFEIIPPYWQRFWFWALVFCLIAVAIKVLYNYKIRQNLEKIMTIEKVRAEEAEAIRKRMARDFHDNMGNQLASITVFTNLISMKLMDQSEEILNLLGNIEKHTKSLFNGTKDFIWSMDPASDDLNEIYTYIKDFGEELFAKTNIQFFSSAEELNLERFPVPGGWSRQIVLVFKEAMTNALKHSQASEIHLDINLSHDGFVLKLRDNGIGFDKETLKRGNGFNNMSMRARQIGCFFSCEQPAAGGIEINLYGKL